MSLAPCNSLRKLSALLPIILVQPPLAAGLLLCVAIANVTMPAANATITTVVMIRPQGVCFWLTIDLPGFFLTGGRAPGLLMAGRVDAPGLAVPDLAVPGLA